MNLIDLRNETFALENWQTLRPFFTRLCPEYIWADIHQNILEEVREELQARKSEDYEYPTYFTYPSGEQMRRAHEHGAGVLMFSEIREVAGYRAAEALSLLAGFIRLESHAASLKTYEECFTKLWREFSDHHYHRGYRTSNVRANLVSILGSNNVFELVEDKSWQEFMLEYFTTESHDWTGKPLVEIYPHIIKILGGDVSRAALHGVENIFLSGKLDLDSFSDDKLQAMFSSMRWEQGEPEGDLAMPSVMFSEDLRGSSQPPSDVYEAPFHMIRVVGDQLEKLEFASTLDPFQRICLHFFICLKRRTDIVDNMGIDTVFNIEDAAEKCAFSKYAVRMVIGQMIKLGLVNFDKLTGEPWYSDEQTYVCNPGAKSV